MTTVSICFFLVHTFVFGLSEATSFHQSDGNTLLAEGKKPVEVTVNIQINKIYGINTVDETYIVDGYLVASWRSPDIKASGEAVTETIIYENDMADEKTGNEIWVPAFEFINVVEKRNTANRRIIISEKGTVTYNERFNAIFSILTNLRIFPFDTQTFTIRMEAFSYSNEELVFLKGASDQDFFTGEISDEWEIIDKKIYVSLQEYSHLTEDGSPTVFSRFNQEILAKRKIQYYLLQFIFPLSLIVIISWSVFWIPGLSDQLSINSTLMLTVVAFNYSASNILPRLSYSTFLESLITLGYFEHFY